MASKFVKCQFNPWDQRSYTYLTDGHDCAVGDKVRVLTNKGEKTVEVVGLTDDEPPFACKPIIGKHVESTQENEHAR